MSRTGNTQPSLDRDEHIELADGFMGKRVLLYGVNPDGTSEIVEVDPTAAYAPSDIEESTTSYFGFVNSAGGWYIMKVDSGAYRYIKGDSDYTTNWTGRAGLSYDYFYNVF